MAFKIVITKRFRNKVASVGKYLEKEWSSKVAKEFFNDLERRINNLEKLPTSGSITAKDKNVRRFSFSKHNRIYYRIRDKKVRLLDLIDTRKDPQKNKYE